MVVLCHPTVTSDEIFIPCMSLPNLFFFYTFCRFVNTGCVELDKSGLIMTITKANTQYIKQIMWFN